MVKAIVAGSRDLQEYERGGLFSDEWVLPSDGVAAVARGLKAGFGSVDEIDEIVSGTAVGPDQWGERFAECSGHVELTRMPADWDRYGKRAGHERNKAMAEYADVLLAFWNGSSNGTADMIELAEERGLETYVVRLDIPCERMEYMDKPVQGQVSEFE